MKVVAALCLCRDSNPLTLCVRCRLTRLPVDVGKRRLRHHHDHGARHLPGPSLIVGRPARRGMWPAAGSWAYGPTAMCPVGDALHALSTVR